MESHVPIGRNTTPEGAYDFLRFPHENCMEEKEYGAVFEIPKTVGAAPERL